MSNNSETMEITDCDIVTNEMNHQDINSANKDGHKKQLEDLIRESNKSSQLSNGDYKMLAKNVMNIFL